MIFFQNSTAEYEYIHLRQTIYPHPHPQWLIIIPSGWLFSRMDDIELEK
jgi:hypothetical protein